MTNRPTARILTIAGSDSGGGAGIQADLATIHALGAYGMSALTALTAQNTVGVHGVHPVPASFVRQQIDVVVDDIGVDATKIGMVGGPDTITAVADALDGHELTTVVLDPVAASKHGDSLLPDDAVAALRDRLVPRALVVTPNVGEVELLTGVVVRGRDDLDLAAEAMLELGARWVVVKGGHLPDNEDATDLLTDGTTRIEVSSRRLDTRDTHGTGCTFSSAIATFLGQQDEQDVPAAVRAAKDYLTGALQQGVRVGQGIGPVDHDWQGRTRGT